jgi:hypothetical protein
LNEHLLKEVEPPAPVLGVVVDRIQLAGKHGLFHRNDRFVGQTILFFALQLVREQMLFGEGARLQLEFDIARA